MPGRHSAFGAAGDVDLGVVAQRTPDFVGADLANIANEAAILAVRHDHEAVTMDDFEAAIDLERASEIARDMVTRLGMSDKLGLLTYGRRQQSLYLGGDYTEEKNYSEDTAQQIDIAVKNLVEEDHQRTRSILEQQRTALDALAARLQEKEVMSGEEVQALLREHASGDETAE